jgi:hypothetical protein
MQQLIATEFSGRRAAKYNLSPRSDVRVHNTNIGQRLM